MAGLALGYILLPLVLVTWLAFFRQEIPSFPPEGYSLKWFGAVLNNKSFVGGFLLSFQIGVAATLIGLALAVPASLAIARRRFRGRGLVNALLLMPLIVPGVVLGPSIYVFQIETEIATGLPLLGSTAGLIAAHVLIVVPWAARLVTASLAGFDPAIEEAAKNLGADAMDDVLARHAAGDPARHRRRRAVRLRHLVRQSRDEPVSRRRRAHHAADRDPAISRMEDRSDGRGRLGDADRADRRRHDGHRPLRQDRAGGLIHMARLELINLSKRYGEHTVVAGVTLDVADGEFLVLLGPSGCGKTTTLRMIAGFVEPSGGATRIGGVDVTYRPPWHRNTGMVFQSYALFPHMTAAENVAFGLEMRKLAKAEVAARAREALRLVRLESYADRLPRQLSGGQQQRVALARALAIRPDVLLLDEPLSNLDAKLREEVRIEIRELQRQLGLTTIMVTHDQEEALTVADRLVVMAEGEIRQIGSQRDLYERPTDRFVAGFVGRSTFLQGRGHRAGRVRDRRRAASASAATAPTGPAALLLRPERLSLGAGSGMDNRLSGKVEFVSYLGAVLELHVRLSPADRVVVQLAEPRRCRAECRR